MAKAQIKMPEEFLKKLSTLAERTDVIIPEVLQAGGEVILDAVRGNLQAVIGSGAQEESTSTGELVSALGISPAKLDRDGNQNVKIGFAEPRSDGKSNSMIAGVIENGKTGQPPRPFLAPAKSKSRAGAIAAMKAKYEEVLK